MDVTDDAVRMLLEIIRRIETQTEKRLHGNSCRISSGSRARCSCSFGWLKPSWTRLTARFATSLFPRVKEDIFRDLVPRPRRAVPSTAIWYQYVMRQKYVRHYRQMLPWVLEHLTFRSENRFQPVIEALAIIKRYLGTKYQYLPEEVPIEGVVLPQLARHGARSHKDGTVRINRQYYELCVLQQLERALKCKEIWVEGSYAFRNPSQDLPADWDHEDTTYGLLPPLHQPVEVTSFIDPLRERLTAGSDAVQS